LGIAASKEFASMMDEIYGGMDYDTNARAA
jgi:hypothetical protein